MKNALFVVALPFLLAGCFFAKNAPTGDVHNLNSRNMTNISSLHEAEKPVSAASLFKGQENTTTALQINKDGLLDKHITKVPALLVCVSGEVVFENEQGFTQTLHVGDFVRIEPMVTHWVAGIEDSQLLLIK